MSARQSRNAHRGATAVEFAVSGSLLFLFVFAGVEFARVNMIIHTAENAAYEGARCGILPGATADDCETSAKALLDMVGISGYTVNTSPIQPLSEDVTVTVDIPITAENNYLTPQFFMGRTVSASITLPREGEIPSAATLPREGEIPSAAKRDSFSAKQKKSQKKRNSQRRRQRTKKSAN